MERGQQFPLKMTARQIVGGYHLPDRENLLTGEVTPTDQFLKDRLAVADRRGITKSILKNGLKKPIRLVTGNVNEVEDGHHRLAVLYHHMPDTPVDVVHETKTMDDRLKDIFS